MMMNSQRPTSIRYIDASHSELELPPAAARIFASKIGAIKLS